MCPVVRPEGWLRQFAHPFGGVVCGGHAQYPAFSPNTLFLLLALQKWQLDFLVFLYLFVHNLPHLRMHSYFQSHIISLYFVAGGDICPGASISAKGARSQVPACLTVSSQGYNTAVHAALQILVENRICSENTSFTGSYLNYSETESLF